MADINEELVLTPKEIKEAEYEAELKLEDMYSRHETCQDTYGCSPIEYLLRAKLQAQLAKATLIIEKQQQKKDTAYYAEMMKDAIDRVSKEAKKQERERIGIFLEESKETFYAIYRDSTGEQTYTIARHALDKIIKTLKAGQALKEADEQRTG